MNFEEYSAVEADHHFNSIIFLFFLYNHQNGRGEEKRHFLVYCPRD